jgi:hypothetical protein
MTVPSGSDNGNWFADIDNRDNITIGVDIRSSGPAYFNGFISNIRVYSAEKSLAQLQRIMGGYHDTADLVGYWPLDDEIGLTARSVYAGGDMTAPAVANLAAPLRFPAPSTGAKTMWSCDFSDTKLSGWTTLSGSFRPIYVDSLSRWGVECVTAGVIGIPVHLPLQDLTASNLRWQWWMYKGADGNTTRIKFVSDLIGAWNKTDSYYIHFNSSEGVDLGEGPGGANLVYTAVSYISNNTHYLVRMDRLAATGAFTGYIGADEASLAEIDLTGGSGSWPVVDTTHLSTAYIVWDIDAGDIITGPITIQIY